LAEAFAVTAKDGNEGVEDCTTAFDLAAPNIGLYAENWQEKAILSLDGVNTK
jgi:hypothetical protein